MKGIERVKGRVKSSWNYDAQLSGEIITGNYELVYYVAENVGIIGILAYPKKYLQGGPKMMWSRGKVFEKF